MGELPTSIDYVINCIGVLRDRTLVKMTDEELDDVLDINLRSTIKLCQRIEPRIRRGGSITLISSIIGEIGGFGQCNYAASKAGIEAFTKSYAMEMARRNIRVNCVVPSIVDTGIFKLLTDEQKQKLIDRTLLKRMATIEEVAKFIKFIAVDATYCTGDILPITGGFR
jgi:3-oxoacyl-[acyl-carrier protein] reductase